MGRFVENEYDGNPQRNASLMAFDGTRTKPYPVQGVLVGDYVVLQTSAVPGLGDGRKVSEVDVAVTNGNTVDFEFTVDADTVVLPTDMEVVGVLVYPHNGAATPVAVSTIWLMKMFSHSDRGVTDVVNINDRTDRPTSPDPSINNSKWDYVNEEGATEIPCSMEIPVGENDATFTVKVLFR